MAFWVDIKIILFPHMLIRRQDLPKTVVHFSTGHANYATNFMSRWVFLQSRSPSKTRQSELASCWHNNKIHKPFQATASSHILLTVWWLCVIIRTRIRREADCRSPQSKPSQIPSQGRFKSDSRVLQTNVMLSVWSGVLQLQNCWSSIYLMASLNNSAALRHKMNLFESGDEEFTHMGRGFWFSSVNWAVICRLLWQRLSAPQAFWMWI